jgi:hypothetical protein
MKNNDAFPYMIDGLFRELTQASYISIDYKGLILIFCRFHNITLIK